MGYWKDTLTFPILIEFNSSEATILLKNTSFESRWKFSIVWSLILRQPIRVIWIGFNSSSYQKLENGNGYFFFDQDFLNMNTQENESQFFSFLIVLVTCLLINPSWNRILLKCLRKPAGLIFEKQIIKRKNKLKKKTLFAGNLKIKLIPKPIRYNTILKSD